MIASGERHSSLCVDTVTSRHPLPSSAEVDFKSESQCSHCGGDDGETIEALNKEKTRSISNG